MPGAKKHTLTAIDAGAEAIRCKSTVALQRERADAINIRRAPATIYSFSGAMIAKLPGHRDDPRDSMPFTSKRFGQESISIKGVQGSSIFGKSIRVTSALNELRRGWLK